MLQQVSPVAWQHINLYGRYEFRKGPEANDLPALIQEWPTSQSNTTLSSNPWNIPFRGVMQKIP
jgi:hypothetical protein